MKENYKQYKGISAEDAQRRLNAMKLWAAEFGGKCLSKEWLGWNKKLLFICKHKHSFERSYVRILGKDGNTFCQECKKASKRKGKK